MRLQRTHYRLSRTEQSVDDGGDVASSFCSKTLEVRAWKPSGDISKEREGLDSVSSGCQYLFGDFKDPLDHLVVMVVQHDAIRDSDDMRGECTERCLGVSHPASLRRGKHLQIHLLADAPWGYQ